MNMALKSMANDYYFVTEDFWIERYNLGRVLGHDNKKMTQTE